MANQIALAAALPPRRRGDRRRAARTSRLYESGAGAAWAGVQFAEVGGADGTLRRRRASTRRPLPDDRNLPHTRLVARREHAQPRRRPRLAARSLAAIVARARARGLALHLDGARLWNAAVAQRALASASSPRRSTPCSACFSKGLGAPVGIGARAAARATSTRAPLPQDARRRHAPGRHPRAPRRCTRSSTTAPASPTITRTRAASPSGWRASRASGSIRTGRHQHRHLRSRGPPLRGAGAPGRCDRRPPARHRAHTLARRHPPRRRRRRDRSRHRRRARRAW